VGRGGEGDGFSQVFGAQKLAGLARTGPCRAARARATPAASAAKRFLGQSPKNYAAFAARSKAQRALTPRPLGAHMRLSAQDTLRLSAQKRVYRAFAL